MFFQRVRPVFFEVLTIFVAVKKMRGLCEIRTLNFIVCYRDKSILHIREIVFYSHRLFTLK